MLNLKLNLLLLAALMTASVHIIQASGPSLDTLAGTLPPNIKGAGKKYLVVSDIEVPLDKVVTIEAGAVILFQNFTGLHVRGKLIANGTAVSPVVFTSELDRKYNPSSGLMANPFDWNGINIHSDGFGSYFEHCVVSYTVYGLVSETKYIRLDPVTFRENGKRDLTVLKEQKRDVIAGTPYRYVLSSSDLKKEGLDIKIIKDPLARKRNFLRYTGLALGLGGAIAGVAHSLQLKEATDVWEDFNSRIPSDDVKFDKTSEEYKNSRSNFIKARAFVITDFAVVGIGLIAFSWSFSF